MARAVGRELVQLGCRVVYGGASVGLMGQVADGALDAGGEVVGVMPSHLVRHEIAHTSLTELIEVPDMHARKQAMFDRADAFVALPGGFGTLEELLEVVTWAQLGLHEKPIAVLNHDGFFDPLLQQIDRAVGAGVMRPENHGLVVSVADPGRLGEAFASYERTNVPKWVN